MRKFWGKLLNAVLTIRFAAIYTLLYVIVTMYLVFVGSNMATAAYVMNLFEAHGAVLLSFIVMKKTKKRRLSRTEIMLEACGLFVLMAMAFYHLAYYTNARDGITVTSFDLLWPPVLLAGLMILGGMVAITEAGKERSVLHVPYRYRPQHAAGKSRHGL